jgi:ferredoxin
MSFIFIKDKNGETRQLEAVEGWRVMEILRDYNTGIEGTCGGGCDCASCHVIIADEWANKLFAARDDELDKLDELAEVYETSRLSCQIIWSPELDGLALTIPSV